MKGKQTSQAIDDIAAEKPGPASKRPYARRRKTGGSNGNGQGTGQALMPLSVQEAPALPEISPPSQSQAKPPIEITDTLFLDTVRDQVFHKLVAGEINLGMGDGFKAIEIKHKISEESQSEKLLLEILGEIRAQELGKAGDKIG